LATERVERRLAAILAADVAGYSRLMGVDEEGTLAALKKLWRELADPKIKDHRGRQKPQPERLHDEIAARDHSSVKAIGNVAGRDAPDHGSKGGQAHHPAGGDGSNCRRQKRDLVGHEANLRGESKGERDRNGDERRAAHQRREAKG
jgi:class 3 adenylate cyclase